MGAGINVREGEAKIVGVRKTACRGECEAVLVCLNSCTECVLSQGERTVMEIDCSSPVLVLLWLGSWRL